MANNLGIRGLKVQSINILSQAHREQIKSLVSQIAREHPEIFYCPTPKPRITLCFTYHGAPGIPAYGGGNSLMPNVCNTTMGEDGTPYFKISISTENTDEILLLTAHEFGHAILTNRLAGSPFEHLMIDDGTDMMPKYAMAYMQETFAWSYAYKFIKDMNYLNNEYTILQNDMQYAVKSYILMGDMGLFGGQSTTVDRLQETLYRLCDFVAISHRLGRDFTDAYRLGNSNFALAQVIIPLSTYISSNGDAVTLPVVKTLTTSLMELIGWAQAR